MRFEYIFLVILSTLPISYKIAYWQRAIKDIHGKVFTSQQGREYVFHFWFFLELPFFAFSILPFISAPFEILLYGMFFYFLILYNIFVIWKILRRKMSFPLGDTFLWCISCIILLKSALVVFFPMSIYLVIWGILVCMPLYFSLLSRFLSFRDTDQADHSEK